MAAASSAVPVRRSRLRHVRPRVAEVQRMTAPLQCLVRQRARVLLVAEERAGITGAPRTVGRPEAGRSIRSWTGSPTGRRWACTAGLSPERIPHCTNFGRAGVVEADDVARRCLEIAIRRPRAGVRSSCEPGPEGNDERRESGSPLPPRQPRYLDPPAGHVAPRMLTSTLPHDAVPLVVDLGGGSPRSPVVSVFPWVQRNCFSSRRRSIPR